MIVAARLGGARASMVMETLWAPAEWVSWAMSRGGRRSASSSLVAEVFADGEHWRLVCSPKVLDPVAWAASADEHWPPGIDPEVKMLDRSHGVPADVRRWILDQIDQGHSTALIAGRLGVHPSTVTRAVNRQRSTA